MTSPNVTPLAETISVIEASYEFMLAYAAQGRDVEARDTAPSIRAVLTDLSRAIGAIEGHLKTAIQGLGAVDIEPLNTFATILGQDAKRAKAALDVVLCVPSITSLLVDNINATVHIRALLTSMFLMDEALSSFRR